METKDEEETTTKFDIKGESIHSKIFLGISIISWLTFLITGYIGLIKLIFKIYIDGISYNNIWSFMNIYIKDENTEYKQILNELDYEYSYFPLQTHRGFYILLFLLLIILATAGFVLYTIKLFIKKDYGVFEGMMGKISKYHFIPLFLSSAMFIIGISQKISFKEIQQIIHYREFKKIDKALVDNYYDKIYTFCECYVVNLLFSIIGFLSLIFIKIKTDFKEDLYMSYCIKNGFYSCLLGLFIYFIFYSAIYTAIFFKLKKAVDIFEENEGYRKIECFEAVRGLDNYISYWDTASSILMGFTSYCTSFLLKDIGIAIINLIIYIGLVIHFYSIDKEDRERQEVYEAEGTIQIIVIAISPLILIYCKYIECKIKNI